MMIVIVMNHQNQQILPLFYLFRNINEGGEKFHNDSDFEFFLSLDLAVILVAHPLYGRQV